MKATELRPQDLSRGLCSLLKKRERVKKSDFRVYEVKFISTNFLLSTSVNISPETLG